MNRLDVPSTLLALCSIVITCGSSALAASSDPERFAYEALGQEGRITLTPTFTPDGKTIYFAQSECAPIWECPQRLKRSTLGPEGWSSPELVPLPMDGRVDFPSVAPDGRTLLFSWAVDRPRHRGEAVYEDFDLYALDLAESGAIPVPIDEPDINRIRGGAIAKRRYFNNENAPVLTRSGDLYFWTERLDGVGERDIYLAPSDGAGGFLTARPLPAPINSAGRDAGSWVNADGNLMLVTYGSRGGSGGDDIFVSRKTGETWSEPVNLGPSVNSVASDFAASISPDGKQLLFSSTRSVDGASDGIIQVWVQDVANVPLLNPSSENAD